MGLFDHDPIGRNRIMISSLCLSMISAQALRVCREGKPVSIFPDHALKRDKMRLNHYRALGYCLSMTFSETRFALFRIML
jgi:hypothetical protein